jgi:L-ascorbate metabolism protein UlaG (beta-lactamase superfamily)
MKVTKFTHSCLFVEDGERAALFDPGVFSHIDIMRLPTITDIFITHIHRDHMDMQKIQDIRNIFPDARITAPQEVTQELARAGIIATVEPPEYATLFTSPHEAVRPYFEEEPPEEIGVHCFSKITHPGDSHSFHETMPVLALPVTAPWGCVVEAVQLALDLKPTYIIPIHDWHWRPEALQGMYGALEQRFTSAGITFFKPVDGQAIEIQL